MEAARKQSEDDRALAQRLREEYAASHEHCQKVTGGWVCVSGSVFGCLCLCVCVSVFGWVFG